MNDKDKPTPEEMQRLRDAASNSVITLKEYCRNESVSAAYEKMIKQIFTGQNEFNEYEVLFMHACIELLLTISAFESATKELIEKEQIEADVYKKYNKLN